MVKTKRAPIKIVAIKAKSSGTKSKFLEGRRKPGPKKPLSRKMQRWIESQRPPGMSLRQWRRQKPKRPFPALSRGQAPLHSVAEAKRLLSIVQEVTSGREKFIMLSNLLSRAHAGSRNREVIKLIQEARHKIPIKWHVEPKALKRITGSRTRLSEGTQLALDTIDHHIACCDPKGSHAAIFSLVGMKKSESRIVASFLEQMAADIIPIMKTETKAGKRKEYLETLFKLYGAANWLYENVSYNHKAMEMVKKIEELQKWQLRGF